MLRSEARTTVRGIAGLGMVVCLLAGVGGAAGAAARAAGIAAGLAVTGLSTEYAPTPLGTDVARPRLGWTLDSAERGQAQTAYRVLVASGAGKLDGNVADVWDSGRVDSGESVGVPYGGPPLASRTRYFWKVQVWDVHGDASEWSSPAWWETALLHPSDWQAQWIGRPVFDPRPDLEGARWIWYPEGNPAQSAPAATRYFRLAFDLPAGRQVARATLTATADNEFTAFLGGAQVVANTDWTRAARTDVTTRLVSGRNVLAVSATNLGGPAGFIARLRIDFTSGDPLVVDAGAGTRTANSAQSGWQNASFNDSAWPGALPLVPFGEGPWGRQATVPRPVPEAAPLLRKEFAASKPIARARVYVGGIGNYVLRINGSRVGDRVLDPAYTEYEDRVLYSTYDVGTLIQQGSNAIAVALAPGFYYYDTPKLLLQARIDYTDGTSEVVVTDQSWQLAEGPTSFAIASDAVFGGESYDARREPLGWDRPAFPATGWRPAQVLPSPGGALVAQAVEPVTVAETVPPVGTTQPRAGTYVVDMGRTLTGWVQLATGGPAGRKVSIQYGEKLNADGTVNATPSPGPRSRWQRDEYVLRGLPAESWEPSFTFKSFRYVQLDGLTAPPQTGSNATVRGRAVHSALPSAREFSSSHTLFNRIHQATRRTIGGALVGFPAIDPAHEKNGWTGDTQLMTPAMTYNVNLTAFGAKWLDDVRDSQRPDGSISMIAPIRDACCYAWAPEWTAAYPIVAWELYVRYGDRRVLESHYPALTKYLQSQTSALNGGIAPASTWGDWAAPGYGVAPEDRRLTATAYLYRQAAVMADIARVLGQNAAADGFRATADQIRQRFNETFLNQAAGRYQTSADPGYRQTSNALPLAFDMVPAQNRAAVVDGLVADVRARGGHLNTGILGTPALLEALTRNGHADLAYGIAAQTTYPSWGEWLNAGADTLWESWGLAGRSRNHPMHGTVDEWFYRDVAGIAPDPANPGYRHVIIQPYPAATVTQASASHVSPYGQVTVAWRLVNGDFVLDAQLPANTTATIRLPVTGASTVQEGGQPAVDAPGVRLIRSSDGSAEYHVGSGSYHFVSPGVRLS